MQENSRVKDQYMRWPYPEPVYDLNEHFKTNKQLGCPSTDRGFYSAFPRRKRFSPSILIAGCGAYQAAAIAFKNPDCEVVGVDISPTSLGLTDDLKHKHALNNLTLHEMSLLHISELGQSFDLIISSGVIHHLPKPTLALEAFKTVLSPGGAAYIMVYGSTLRTGIYWLQTVFKALAIEPQTDDDVWEAMKFIKKLPKHHPVHAYIDVAGDLSFPGGIIDTFFHSQDVSYTVNDVLDLAMEARLEFNGFQLNTCYFHEAILGSALSEHYAGQFSTLSFRRQAAIVDLAGSHRGTHRFYLGEDKTFTLDETMAPDNFDEVVSATVGLQRYETTNGIGMAYRLEPYAEFYPGTLMVTVTNLINAERTFGDITDELVRKIEGIRREQAREVVFKIARDLWMRGVLLFVG